MAREETRLREAEACLDATHLVSHRGSSLSSHSCLLIFPDLSWKKKSATLGGHCLPLILQPPCNRALSPLCPRTCLCSDSDVLCPFPSPCQPLMLPTSPTLTAGTSHSPGSPPASLAASSHTCPLYPPLLALCGWILLEESVSGQFLLTWVL